MDSNHSSEADSEESYDSELLDFVRRTRFFNRADHIKSAKKPDLPSISETTWKYRAPSETCKKCRSVILTISKITASGSTFDAKHHQTYTAIKSSAENGCGICSIFFREFRLERQDEDDSDEKRECSWISASGSSFLWEVTIPWIEGDPNPKDVDMEGGDSGGRYCFKARIESFLAVSQSKMLYSQCQL